MKRLNNLQDKLLNIFNRKNKKLYINFFKKTIDILNKNKNKDKVNKKDIDKELNKEIITLSKKQGELVKEALSSAYIYINKDKRRAYKILKENWNDTNYSERIYKEKIKLKKVLIKELSRGLNNKDDNEEVIKNISRKLDISMNNAKRLVNTEMTAVINRAETDKAIKEGKTKYEYVATIDDRTSDICRDLNGKVFDIKDLKVGVNAGPLHPNCRSRIKTF